MFLDIDVRFIYEQHLFYWIGLMSVLTQDRFIYSFITHAHIYTEANVQTFRQTRSDTQIHRHRHRHTRDLVGVLATPKYECPMKIYHPCMLRHLCLLLFSIWIRLKFYRLKDKPVPPIFLSIHIFLLLRLIPLKKEHYISDYIEVTLTLVIYSHGIDVSLTGGSHDEGSIND